MAAAQGHSEVHNKREQKLDYVYEDLSKNNESWEKDKISDRLQAIKSLCVEKSGRKLQKNAEPIREAVVKIKSTTSMDDLKRLSDRLKKELKLDAFQIHIHRDEGKSREELNNHAHILFDIQDKDKGTTLKFDKQGLSQMQDIVAEVLEMERGETSSKRHLKAMQYKNQQEALKLAELELKIAELSKQLENITKDTQENLKSLESLKTDKNLEFEKFAKIKDFNSVLENGAKGVIVESWMGINVEKTTANVAQLISMNTTMKRDIVSLKERIDDKNREIRSLETENRTLKTNVQELAKFKEISAKAILKPKYNMSYGDKYIEDLRLDKDFDRIYKKVEADYKNPTPEVKQEKTKGFEIT